MNSLPDRQKVEEALNRICKHKLFKRSYTNELLLRFLIDQAYEGNDVKEQTIGVELFSKDYTAEKSDSKIRVSVYYLRKKLKAYYETEGKKEDIRFEIKKGQYNLSFINREEARHRQQHDEAHTITIPINYLKYAALVSAALILGFFLLKYQSRPDYCWKEFYKHNASNACVVSDHFVYTFYHPTRKNEFTTNVNINNYNKLLEYNKNNPTDKLIASDFTSFSKMAPLSTHHLTKWFNSHGKDFSVLLESELRYEDYKNNNIIFIGQAKNMLLSNSIFLKDSKRFRVENANYYSIIDGVETRHDALLGKGEVLKEYAFVSFVSVDNCQEAIFFTSQHDIGVMSTVKNFTNKKWLKEFYSRLPKGTKHFNALFEVSGLKRNDVVCKLVDVEVLP